MAYCPECGAEITSEEVFCGNCGIALIPLVAVGENIAEAPISEDEARDANAPPVAAEPPKSIPAAGNDSQSSQIDLQNSEKLSAAPVEKFAPQKSNSEAASTADSREITKSSTEKTVETDRQTVENRSTKTESVEIPRDSLGEIESEKLRSTATEDATADSVSKNNLIIEIKAEANILPEENPPVSTGNDKTGEDFQLDPEPEIPDSGATESAADDFDSAQISDGANIKSSVAKIAENSAADNINPNLQNDESRQGKTSGMAMDEFQATLPYTPTDFAAREALAGQLAESKPPEKIEPNKPLPADAEKFAVGADAAPIKPPVDLPVGSAMHDSLEPTSVSVQIFDPKENPVASEPKTAQKSAAEVLKSAEQTNQSEEPKPARSFTTPNIGGNDTDGKSKAKLKPLDEGTILNNRYEIVRKIGGGGMGAVYLASDKNLGGISRAVKEMVQSYIEDAQQEKAVNDFRRESMLLTSLEHPSIPTIYDYFFDEAEARFYLVMKYISGGDLAARLRSAPGGRIDEGSVTEWAIQLADVLDYLHNRQPPIVYRDLKPSNIMIDGNTGKVMLIDFGIARWVNKEEKGVTAVGTMGYAPPELFSGNVEPRSDIYSLGSTMFHLLTGADPQSNPLLIFDFQKNPRPRQINPQLTDQMEQILLKTVEYSANKRFASAAELRDALVLHLDNLKRGNVTIGAADSGAKASPPAAKQLVFCGFCGQKILAADVFCPFCGAQQAATSGAVSGQAAYNPPKTTARLMIIGTSELDSPVFNLEKDTNLVGRRDPMSNIFPEVDLSKFDPQTKISRRHARIWRERDSFMVEDLGSSNGTILIAESSESQKLGKNQPRALTSGDKIRVGDTTLCFVLE